ncbi:MAG: hypothetical protein ACKOVB_07740 [Terrabacter sp.]
MAPLPLVLGFGLPAVAGLFAAGHAASWGAFKDSPFEGFRWASYARTLVLGVVIAVAVSLWLPLTGPASAVVLIGVTYALERLGTEWWKSIVRNDDQAAYTIPMRLGFLGRTVESRSVRYAVGAAVAGVVVLGLVGLHLAQTALGGLPAALGLLATWGVGSLGGWATAVGGAWKDAPVEGFSPWKFLRSPAVAIAWAIPLSALTASWPALVVAAAGLAVVSIETYKTFFTRGRPPGKFAGKPARPVGRLLRRAMALQNAAWWLAFGALLGLSASVLVVVAPEAIMMATLAVGSAFISLAVVRQGLLQAQPVSPTGAA